MWFIWAVYPDGRRTILSHETWETIHYESQEAAHLAIADLLTTQAWPKEHGVRFTVDEE